MKPMSKGPQGPRRSPQQAMAAKKQRDILQQQRDQEMSDQMRRAYENVQAQSVSGMKSGGMTGKNGRDGCAIRGRTRA